MLSTVSARLYAAPSSAAAAMESRDYSKAKPPIIPVHPLSRRMVEKLVRIGKEAGRGISIQQIRELGESGDVRLAWAIADLMRFIQLGDEGRALIAAASRLSGLDLESISAVAWVALTNQLIDWDVPAPQGYRRFKQALYSGMESDWERLFSDVDADLDWRLVTWGGVSPDRRRLDDNSPCECIPSLDHPTVTAADDANWYQDSRLIFGVVANGEARAYPKHMMEVHELVNDRLGGREIALPYCTLCGSAQAFLVDGANERRVMRTSGLLQRSNKIMYDLRTFTYYDTFEGRGVAGPLQGEILPQVTVITATWGEWKANYPETTILAQDGGIGRRYPQDPLRGRDANGPIFPVGVIDKRLPAVEQVVGVLFEGRAYAFPVDQAKARLNSGGSVAIDKIEVISQAGGLTAVGPDGPLSTHQAYWFAWSQFNPRTRLWRP